MFAPMVELMNLISCSARPLRGLKTIQYVSEERLWPNTSYDNAHGLPGHTVSLHNDLEKVLIVGGSGVGCMRLMMRWAYVRRRISTIMIRSISGSRTDVSPATWSKENPAGRHNYRDSRMWYFALLRLSELGHNDCLNLYRSVISISPA